MYVVKNISTREISMPDLHIVLSPGDQIDIDMMCARFRSEQSFGLKQLIVGGYLKVIIRDDHRGGIQIKTPEAKMPEDMPEYIPKNRDVLDAVKDMEEKLGKKIDEKIANSQQSQIDPNLLNQALSALQALASGGVAAPQVPDKVINTEISDKKAVEIQQRMLNRKAINTESNVTHTEQIVDNSDIKKNMDELEGLL